MAVIQGGSACKWLATQLPIAVGLHGACIERCMVENAALVDVTCPRSPRSHTVADFRVSLITALPAYSLVKSTGRTQLRIMGK